MFKAISLAAQKFSTNQNVAYFYAGMSAQNQNFILVSFAVKVYRPFQFPTV